VTPSLGQLRGHLTKAQIMLHVSCWQFSCQSAETAPDFHQPNDWQKRWDLVSCRNVSHKEAALVCGGRLTPCCFQWSFLTCCSTGFVPFLSIVLCWISSVTSVYLQSFAGECQGITLIIVISLSEICDRDWSYTRHVICTDNHCWPVQQHLGEHDSCSQGTWPAGRHPMHSWLIFGPNAILGRSNIYSASGPWATLHNIGA